MKDLNEIILKEVKKTQEEIINDINNTENKLFFLQYDENELKNIVNFLDSVMIRTNSGTGETISKKRVRNYFFLTPDSFRKRFEQNPSNLLWRGDVDHPCNDVDYMDYHYYLQSYSNKDTARFFGDTLISSKEILSYNGCFSTSLFNKIISYKDLLFLNSFIFYNKYPEYKNQFEFKLFYKIYFILKGYGLLGKKYKIYFMKLLKKMDLNFYNQENYVDQIQIADDEGEVLFFDVVYKCKIK
jgi:hypothetical protein